MGGGAPSRRYAALPWRRKRGVEILLITSRETGRRVIPKGWPMLDLPPHQCAAREAFEEAGIGGTAAASALGHYRYGKRRKDGRFHDCRVDVFTLEVTRQHRTWPEAAERRRRWFPAGEAALAVDEAELAVLILRFARRRPGRGR